MTVLRQLCAVCILLTPPALAQKSIWFTDDFHRSVPDGAWTPVNGSWQPADTMVRIDTQAYDQITVCSTYVYGFQPWTIEAIMRGLRSGIVFNLDDTTSRALSHMVRFEEKSLLAGYFNSAGEFVATSTFDLPRAATSWTKLSIAIDPASKKYTIAVNDSVVGVDTVLRFPSGFAGLQASGGVCEFRSFSIRGEGRQKGPPPLKVLDPVPLRHIRMSGRAPRIEVYDPERRAYLTLDHEGRLLRERPARRPPSVRGAVTKSFRYRIKGNAVIKETLDRVRLATFTERLVKPTGLAVTDDSKIYVLDAGAGAIFLFDGNGHVRKSYEARAFGGFTAPRGMHRGSAHTLLVGDYDRIILVPTSLDEGEPIVSHPTSEEAVIKWATGTTRPVDFDTNPYLEKEKPGPGRLLLLESDTHRSITATVTPDWRTNRITLTGLNPLQRYTFEVSPVYGTIPPSTGWSREYRFSTLPEDTAEMALTRIPVMCMIYRTISYRDVYPEPRYSRIPWGRTISPEEIDYLREACRFNSEFYFRNSGCRVVLDFTLHVVDDTLHLRDVGESDPYWLSLNDRVTRDFEHAAEKAGHDPSWYNGLIVPYAWINHPPRRTSAMRDPSTGDSITIRQMYGGATFGVPAPWKYGKTTGYTGNPFQDRFSRQDWLITHEFHHQIDALMDASGFPGYYHADQPWKMPGRFGEDFNFNAAIIRNAPREWWLNLKFGTLASTRDADHDSVPDADPSLPFDEDRLGGDPGSPDTDGDGLRDLEEVMAGTESGTSLILTDTDGDGYNDLIDPEPLYPFAPRVNGSSIMEFARPDSLTVYDLGFLGDTLFAVWICTVPQDDSLGFLLQIDANNDGWFHGFDNTQIRIRCGRDSVTVLDYYLRDCSSWIDPPKDRKDILHIEDLTVKRSVHALSGGMKRVALMVRIPPDPEHGLSYRVGKRMGIRVGMQTAEDRWVWHELFERNYMMSVELTDIQ